MTQKIQNILEKTNSRLFIFIEGLNEAGLDFIFKLNKDFSRLKNLRITFILSFTNITARRLFTDTVNNITELANYLSLSIKDLEALEIDSSHINKNIITIPSYTNIEANEAMKKYAKVYNVEVQTNKLFYDPFLLRIIMSYYKGRKFNGDVDEIELLEYYIKEKLFRTKFLNELTIENILENITKDIFLYDSPLPLKNILNFSTSENIESLFESALLSKTYKNNKKYLEFYNEREQCYYISLVTRDWNIKFNTYDSFLLEINNIFKTNAGKLALGWYFKINPLIIKEYWAELFSSELYEVQSIFLKSLRLFLINCDEETRVWFSNLIEKGLVSKEKKIKVESLKLIHFFPNLKKKVLDNDYENEENLLFLEEILFNDNEELGYDPFDIINYETLKFLHHEAGSGYIEDSGVTVALKKIIIKEQNQKALEALAYCAPFVMIIFLDEESNHLQNLVNKTPSLVDYMQTELDYHYFNFMGCPGFFENADQEELINEYEGNFDYHSKFLKVYTNEGLLDHFQSLLETTKSYLNENSIKILINKNYISQEENILVDHPSQTYIDFDKL